MSMIDNHIENKRLKSALDMAAKGHAESKKAHAESKKAHAETIKDFRCFLERSKELAVDKEIAGEFEDWHRDIRVAETKLNTEVENE